jgi:hypothetical protein
MQLQRKYRAGVHAYFHRGMSNTKFEEFCNKLDDILNEYKVYHVEATLDPFGGEVKMINTNDEN